MQLYTIIKDFLLYHEPQNHIFELLEDEPEDQQWGPNPVPPPGSSVQEPVDLSQADGEKPSGSLTRPTKKLKKLEKKATTWHKTANQQNSDQAQTPVNLISANLETNLVEIKQLFNAPTNQDVVIREFKIMQQADAFIVYIDGMASGDIINDYILRQLMSEATNPDQQINLNFITNNMITINQIVKEKDMDLIVRQILNGLTALFVNGIAECIILESRGYEKRSISQPVNESVIRGPHEAFVENLRTNLTMVRRVVRNKDLITEMLPMGKADNLLCAVTYIEGIVNPRIVQEVIRRITSLDLDFIPGSGGLEQLIEDHPYSIFPQIMTTERPDRTASFLLDGKVAIICDGSPYAIVVPVTFFHFLHTSEDTYSRWQYGSFLRGIRILAHFITVFLPGFYIALTLYHQEMIPTDLLYSLSQAREEIPFPVVFELLLMEISFELIREASLRVPGTIGQTLGIIGAIVLGQAAVNAGFVSPVLIIIVAITGLSSFAIPSFSLSFAFRMIRFYYIFFGALAGFYGIAAASIILITLASSMKSFGVPYLSPIAPVTKSSPDIGVRGPIWNMTERPDFINPKTRPAAGKTVRGWIKPSNQGEDQ